MSLDQKSKTYSLHFMDGYKKDNVPQRRLRKVPSREKTKKPIGKKFYDNGDYIPGDKKSINGFNRGEFIVLCYQPGSGKQTSIHCRIH